MGVFKRDVWQLKKYRCRTANLDKLNSLLTKKARCRGLLKSRLGRISEDSLFLYYPSRPKKKNPNILVAGAFHGDEPAGSWGILRFLETAPKYLFNKINISFIPVVNPSGFRAGYQRNKQNQMTNAGYWHYKKYPKASLSEEGKILNNNLPALIKLAKDGFLSLHEDYDERRFYIYDYEKAKRPAALVRALVRAEKVLFPPIPDGILEQDWDTIDRRDVCIKNGIVFNHHDGSFEDRLMHDGVSVAISTETPSKKETIENRIEMNANLIKVFAENVYIKAVKQQTIEEARQAKEKKKRQAMLKRKAAVAAKLKALKVRSTPNSPPIS